LTTGLIPPREASSAPPARRGAVVVAPQARFGPHPIPWGLPDYLPNGDAEGCLGPECSSQRWDEHDVALDVRRSRGVGVVPKGALCRTPDVDRLSASLAGHDQVAHANARRQQHCPGERKDAVRPRVWVA